MSQLKDVASTLGGLKLIMSIQADLSYFNSVVPQVFSTPSVYAAITTDIQFINQIGNQIFNYYANPDTSVEKIWYTALASGLTQSIADANNLLRQIPKGTQAATDLTVVLNSFIADCEALQKIIPNSREEK